jgi:glycosyltransferase involved in cell wall biosynthesis
MGQSPAVHARATVSVVIPSYNHERFVGEAIASVSAQTLPAGELLVIDDGSTDASLAVIADHVDRAGGATRVISQANRGAHATINRAVRLSEGEYVAILNSDDVFEPERLEHAWSAARAGGAALVFGSVALIDAEGGPLPDSHETARWYRRAARTVAEAPSLAAGLRRENLAVTTSNLFFHKELWRRIGGFRPYRYVHDYDFVLRAVELCPDRVVFAEDLRDVRYRVHGGNTIAEDVERALGERAEMLRALSRPVGRIQRALTRWREAGRVVGAVTAARVYRPVGAPVQGPAGAPAPGRVGGPAESARTPSRSAARPADGLRVGIVVPSLDRGGLEEIVALLAHTLPAHGVAPTVLCTHAGGAVADRLRASGIPVGVGDGRQEGWRKWVEAERPDAISSHFASLEAVEILFDAAVPIVETIHNTYAWFTDADWVREAAKARLLTATIAVSSTVARYHAAHCPGERPSHVVPNAVDPGRAARVPRPFARRWLGVEEHAPLFVHHGRMAAQKNLPGLLAGFAETIRSVPSARLVLAGPTDGGDILPRLRRDHRSLFRAGAVHHVGRVEAVGALLSAADAFVSDSLYEGWSVAASEGLWVGIPAVLSDCGSAAELVGRDGERGRLVPNPVGDPLAVGPGTMARPPEEAAEENRLALAAAIVDIARSRTEWADRAPEIRAFARARLAPDRLASEYARILGAVAGPAGARVL